ncbi:MAG: Hint domain-containing protein [Paracoccaceae bacterium]
MAEVELTVTPYNGSLLAANLLSGQQTLVLSSFGSTITGTLADDDGTLDTGDSGVSTFEGQAVTYIGSGTVQPGVRVGMLTVPLGTPVDVVLFSVGGQIYFVYPEGPPSITGAVALVVNVTPAAYHLFSPVCFAADTLIATPLGERPVQDIRAGDEVLDCDGQPHRVIWSGHAARDLPLALIPDAARWLPVVIPANALGEGLPWRELRLSQQHRVMIEGAEAELLFGASRVLSPAVGLLGDVCHLDRQCRHVDYHHILCDCHLVLQANGLPAESLLPGPQARRSMARAEAEALFPDLPGGDEIEAALPLLRMSEARLLNAEMTRRQHGH